MKITIFEWIFDKQSDKLKLRQVKRKVKVKYSKELDSYYCEYKNAKIPLKLDYIIDDTFNAINYENSFIPFIAFDFDIKQVDDISKPTKRQEKIKSQMEEVRELKAKKEKLEEMLNNLENDDEKKDSKEVKALIVDMKKRIMDYDEKISRIYVPKDYIIKACALPMAIRSWYLTEAKRIRDKHSGFLEKYGLLLAMIIFATFGIGLTYVIIKTTGDVSVKNIESLTTAIAEGIKNGMSGTGTTTPTMDILPP